MTRVGTWNLDNKAPLSRDPKARVRKALELMDRHTLDVLLVQEAAPYSLELRRAARDTDGLVYISGTRSGESNTGILVRDHEPTYVAHLKATPRGWNTVHGGRTAPKYVPAAVVDRIKFASVHLPPSTWRGRRFGGPKQRVAAYRAHMRSLRLWAITRWRTAPLFIAGDWNATPAHRGTYSPAWLAGAVKGRISAPRRGTHGKRTIDFAVIRGVEVLAGPSVYSHGGDHDLVVWAVRRA